MKLVAESGLWSTGPAVAEPPAVAVLEVSGAVLSWTVDDPAGVAATRLTVTNVVAADWLWRIVGPSGHAAIVAALAGPRGEVDLIDVELLETELVPLRRLAFGHWLRRWWPESSRDGIAALDAALLDGELALLTSAAEEFFTEDTLDSGVDALLAPSGPALSALAAGGDPRIVDLVRSCSALAEEAGISFTTGVGSSGSRRADYALAAGPEAGRSVGAIASGVGSVDWNAVPHGLFDAAEGTVDWSIAGADGAVLAMVDVAATGRVDVGGIEVRLRSGAVSAGGVLDSRGAVAMTVLGEADVPLSESLAWDHDWASATVSIGAVPTDGVDRASAEVLRQRIREFARSRLAQQGPDAFLAEVVAAESDF